MVLAASLGGLGALFATAVYGGKLVFEHAAGIPTKVLEAEMHERAEGHHHHGGEGEADEHGTDENAATARGADSAAGGPAATTADSSQPAGHTHAPGTPPHKD